MYPYTVYKATFPSGKLYIGKTQSRDINQALQDKRLTNIGINYQYEAKAFPEVEILRQFPDYYTAFKYQCKRIDYYSSHDPDKGYNNKCFKVSVKKGSHSWKASWKKRKALRTQ